MRRGASRARPPSPTSGEHIPTPPSSPGLGVRGWTRPRGDPTPGPRGALGDLPLRPRKRRAALRSGESARGCHFKLKRERAGGPARGSARRAPGSVPGLRRSSSPPPRPRRAPGPRRAPLRRAPGDTAGVALRATARLGARVCALRETGGEPGAGAGAGAGVSTHPAAPSARRTDARRAPSPRRGPRAPRAPRACTPAPRLHTHARHRARRAPFPATPRTAHRIELRPARPPRVCTRAAPPGHLHASPAPALHARPSHLHSTP